jgi:hypothetical protein
MLRIYHAPSPSTENLCMWPKERWHFDKGLKAAQVYGGVTWAWIKDKRNVPQ